MGLGRWRQDAASLSVFTSAASGEFRSCSGDGKEEWVRAAQPVYLVPGSASGLTRTPWDKVQSEAAKCEEASRKEKVCPVGLEM